MAAVSDLTAQNSPANPPDHSDLGTQKGKPMPPGHALKPNMHKPKGK